MKMLFSSTDLSEVTSVKSLLSKAGIPCDILNDAMSPAMLEMALYPELWIEKDEDFLAASVLLASWRGDLPGIVASRNETEPAMNFIPLQTQ